MCEVFTNILAGGQAEMPEFLQAIIGMGTACNPDGCAPVATEAQQDWSASVSLAVHSLPTLGWQCSSP
jgi:hypothetical protein